MCKFAYIIRIGEMTAGSCQPLSILYIIIATAPQFKDIQLCNSRNFLSP